MVNPQVTCLAKFAFDSRQIKHNNQMYSLSFVIANLLVIMLGVTAAPTSKHLVKTTTRTTMTTTTTPLSSAPVSLQHKHRHYSSHENRVEINAFSPSSFSSSSIGLISNNNTTNNNNNPNATTATGTTTLRLRKRHRKRHSIWYDYNNYNENSTILEWSNPCGGVSLWGSSSIAKHIKRPTKKEQKRIYNILRNTAINNYNRLNNTHHQDIDISNIEIWWLHNYTYKFLPKLKMNSSIALKRWYRNMQTYAASFAYLRRIQLKWDHSKSQRESNTSAELKELLNSSRNMLCELEAAVNKTHPYKARRNDRRHIPQITRAQMNKRLKLRTKQRMDRIPHDLQEADSIDLKFVKFHYFEYLKNMWQILKKFNKRKGQVALRSHLNQAGMEQQQLQQQQQQQQRRSGNTSSASGSSSINTQFNEIEKSSASGKSQAGTRGKRRKNSKSKHKLAS